MAAQGSGQLGQHEMLTPRHDMEPVDEEAEDNMGMGQMTSAAE